MAFDIQFENLGGCVLFRATGRTTVDGMESLARAIRAELDRTGLRGAVIDCAGMTGALELTDLFRVGEAFAAALGGGIRVAGVNMPTQWRDNRFSEDVVENRGGALRHFSSLEEAVFWASREDA